MGDTKSLHLLCPQGHLVKPVHTEEKWREEIENETLTFFCATCNAPWTASTQEVAYIRQWLDGAA